MLTGLGIRVGVLHREKDQADDRFISTGGVDHEVEQVAIRPVMTEMLSNECRAVVVNCCDLLNSDIFGSPGGNLPANLCLPRGIKKNPERVRAIS